MKSIVKIDLCKSKIFAAEREKANPKIREEVLQKLLKVSKELFPEGDDPYPKGTFYKADGDAVYFILDRSSVALRCGIEFMQTWYHEALPDYPECRIIIDHGSIGELDAPGKTELVGKCFENISIIEKDLGEGQIYVTHFITQDIDQTMANFTFFRQYDLGGEPLIVYTVNYLDPRTVPDSSLLHAVFVANPKATEARDRVIELFLVEYSLEKGDIRNLEDVLDWGRLKTYSLPHKEHLRTILRGSSFFVFQKQGDHDVFIIPVDQKALIERARVEFFTSRTHCIETVTAAVHKATSSDQSTQGVNMGALIESYLGALFSEVRMMANYFRDNHQMFQESGEKFVKFDYILKRVLPILGPKQFAEWKTGFFIGLRYEAEKDNLFIAAVFHNVLATYYLNRSTKVSPYQITKLATREIYFDTNILYSLLVNASSYHEIVKYIMTYLGKIGLKPKVFPFTIAEYEQSLESVERQCPDGRPSFQLQEKNPWLLQEFKSNPGKYLGSITACRRMHSIAKGLTIVDKHYEELEKELQKHGLKLERDYITYPEEKVQELWTDFRSLMPRGSWGIGRYFDFLYLDSLRPESVKSHDVHCIQNLIEKTLAQQEDELGMKTLFLTLDMNRLLRLRRKYPFILAPEQFLEFFLPYFFLIDIPLIEAETFPNRLLAAGLGTLLVSRPPEAVDMLRHFLDNPSLLDSQDVMSETGKEMATALNSDRFRDLAKMSKELPDGQKSEVANRIVEILDKERKVERGKYYSDLVEFRAHLTDKDRKIEKLERKVRYWRSKARKT